MKNAFFYETVCGSIGIAENGLAITNVFFGHTVTPKEYTVVETPLLQKAANQLHQYLNNSLKQFDLALESEGTAFQKKVWSALLSIPYGETRTYKQISEQIGQPNASRAVGHANSLNPISIFIPCHRVIGANGKLTGYAGGLAMKEYLLDLEQKT